MSGEATRLGDDEQSEVLAFLGSSGAYGAGVSSVERIETHGAFVFLAGEYAYKIKRSVRYSYMDFSSLELRWRACARELEINRPHAPELYLGVVAITREANGDLAIDGAGAPVEWAVHMRRFDNDDLLSCVAERIGIDAALARDIADAIHAYHAQAVVGPRVGPHGGLDRVVEEIIEALTEPALGFDQRTVWELESAYKQNLTKAMPVLDERALAGHVRRCHGDLHLGNIVLWQGRPTLFDAIEFDEAIATIDTLYDLAFLLMDLDQRRQCTAANIILNRYLWRSQSLIDIAGLSAMPLFLGLRAAIRAMVTAQRAALEEARAASKDRMVAARYLNAALGYLRPVPPRLIAVGGPSGTGKSTLAAALAPLIEPAPGGLHLRSDLERKAMHGVGETERLPAGLYTPQTSRQVYDILLRKARCALTAGHSVIVDAVYLAADERNDVESVARETNVPFSGLWLTAPEELLMKRVAGRTADASDATPDVVRRQLDALHLNRTSWHIVDASGTSSDSLNAALRHLRPSGLTGPIWRVLDAHQGDHCQPTLTGSSASSAVSRAART